MARFPSIRDDVGDGFVCLPDVARVAYVFGGDEFQDGLCQFIVHGVSQFDAVSLSGNILGGLCVIPHGVEDVDDVVDFGLGEHRLRAGRGKVGEG